MRHPGASGSNLSKVTPTGTHAVQPINDAADRLQSPKPQQVQVIKNIQWLEKE